MSSENALSDEQRAMNVIWLTICIRTEIEQNIKWDATRRALTVVFGSVVILIATLTAADHLTREEAEEVIASRKLTNSSSFNSKATNDALLRPTKSAEELGLVANYDEGDGSRFV